MITVAYIAIGGAIGALLRYALSTGIYTLLGRSFPWGTLVVNVIGSLFMGFLFVILVERNAVNEDLRAMIFVGLLGSFTTFSSFSIETINLLESGDVMPALINVFISVFFCLIACWLGIFLARQI